MGPCGELLLHGALPFSGLLVLLVWGNRREQARYQAWRREVYLDSPQYWADIAALEQEIAAQEERG